jgi:hypothetical protein
MVTIQNQDGQWVDLRDKKSIEQAIVDSNKAKFEQSFHTPFMKPPLSRDFGFKGLTMASQAVLSHIYIPHPSLSTHIVDLLDALHKPPVVSCLPNKTMNLPTRLYRA